MTPSAVRAGKVIPAMADGQGERQARQQAFAPSEPNRLLSDEALQYVDLAARLKAEAVTDPHLNGADALARLRGSDGG